MNQIIYSQYKKCVRQKSKFCTQVYWKCTEHISYNSGILVCCFMIFKKIVSLETRLEPIYLRTLNHHNFSAVSAIRLSLVFFLRRILVTAACSRRSSSWRALNKTTRRNGGEVQDTYLDWIFEYIVLLSFSKKWMIIEATVELTPGRGWNGIRTHDLCNIIPVQYSANWAIMPDGRTVSS